MKLKNRVLFVLLLAVWGVQFAPAQSEAPKPAASTAPEVPAKAAEPAPPEHPATAEQVREFLAVTDYAENTHKLMLQTYEASRKSSPAFYTASFWNDIEKAAENLDVVTPAIPVYQKYYSREDLAVAIAFYKSPAGRRFLAAQPFISSATGDMVQKQMREIGSQVAQKHKDEIQRMMKQLPAVQATPVPAK